MSGSIKYCPNCGTEVVQGGKFCFNCGAKLSEQTFKQTTPKEHDLKLDGAKFNIYGGTMTFSQDLADYNKIRRLFITYSYRNKRDFISEYRHRVQNFDEIFTAAIDMALEKIQATLKYGVSVLIQNGIDNIDINTLTELSFKDIDYSRYIEPFVEYANQIQQIASQISSYRDLQRMGRGKWSGGGFGLSGAIKGAMMAGALNAGTGIFRGIGDSVANSRDRAKISKIKREIFEDPTTLETLSNGVYYCCYGVFFTVRDILLEYQMIPQISFEIKSTNARFNNILEQFKEKRIDGSSTLKAMLECLSEYPYEPRYYTEIYLLAGDKNRELLSVADYFGLKEEYLDNITRIDLGYLNSLRPTEKDTVEDIEKKINYLELLKQSNPRINIDEVREELNGRKSSLENKLKNQLEVNNLLSEAKILRKSIDEALASGNFDYVWEIIAKGNGYAEYALESYYYKLLEPYINNQDIPNFNKALKDIKKLADNGNEFATYLLGYFMYKIYSRDRQNALKAREGVELVIGMADKGVISAMAMMGFWYYHGYEGLPKCDEAAVELLQVTADFGHPMSMAWLGSFYRKGEAGLPVDEDTARKLLEVSAEYGHPYAIRELGKLNRGSSTGGCYITTAVCSSFKKSDDCYELNMLRKFRDEWLINQQGGKELVTEYYRIAPKIVEFIDSREHSEEIYRDIWKTYIKPCLKLIELKRYAECRDLYVKMVQSLEVLAI